MDSNLAQRRRGLEEKIPDIKKTLSMVEFLRDRRVRYLHERGARGTPTWLPLNFLSPFPNNCCLTKDVGVFSLPHRRSFRKETKGRRDQTQAILMTNCRTRMNTMGSLYRSRRHLSSQTRSTQRLSSKKRTPCIYGSGYVLHARFSSIFSE